MQHTEDAEKAELYTGSSWYLQKKFVHMLEFFLTN
jgi:hypothetical protein